MSKKKNINNRNSLKPETKKGIWAVIFFVLAIFSLLSIFRLAGSMGDFFFKNFLKFFFGFGYLLAPIILFSMGVLNLKTSTVQLEKKHWISSGIFLLSSLGLLEVIFGNKSGGLLGLIARPLIAGFDKIATSIILVALIIISILVLFETHLDIPSSIKKMWFKLFKNKETKISGLENDNNEDDEKKEGEEALDKARNDSEKPEYGEEEGKDEQDGSEELEEELETTPYQTLNKEYIIPPLSLLEKDRGKPNVGDIKANSNIIKRTLQNFGIEVEMDEITVGPTITRYALKPAEGIKLSRIISLQNDLALSLAAHPIRIEAPIPGRSLVGIEIPNKTKSTVGLATLLSDQNFINPSKPLTIVLGKGISGNPLFGSIAKMPHLLIAGATGSGKSVTIHSIITSLLYKNGPEDLRFIMIDPKRVELPIYNKIPHLLTPVITDPKKTILALKWAIKEMERRYDVLESESVRDIASFHKKWEEGLDKMPYLVIVIDELADIMSTYPRELESAIIRLAQMSRAVGIHLILSTQRPSVNIITGLIKANIPARIALQVSSQVDSRTILDTGGAEKLLGAGDMLYISGEMSQPRRLQSAFISEDEVNRVVNFLFKNYKDELPSEIELSGNINVDKSIFTSTLDDEEDELYEEAKELVIQAGKASTSYLQRKIKVGYARAARLIDMLEERGIVGPADGAKSREVFESFRKEDFLNSPSADIDEEQYKEDEE
ncbi:hypothetical protein A2995_00865 [Candidatus Nomurabacteria bacterium RIFCSPLOWO2_01_FULL_33_24]|uniref:FtsK domain-containing protein n=1 Tax=Candidatus Nomurabacteria bacterium RIFCSPLOWO2_01_FULL_33_24 TaxID=1801765 RepID=A0A1F6X2N9_9BACT|nr:MAG: hypothetical protein A2995_00865 [Candidatus Nomurabacteria bacterium RIFCSPLOWO2_01_FULL_33_24]